MKLAELLRLVALECGRTFSGSATGGSTTTLADSLNLTTLDDDFLNDGVLWFLSGANKDKTARITDFAQLTGTITFGTLSAVVAGDTYTACGPEMNKQELIDAVNRALSDVGRIVMINSTLTAVTGTTEYTLPAGVQDVKSVRINGEKNFWWEEVNGKLRFDNGEPATGATVEIYYIGDHSSVSADADTINTMLNPSYVKWAAVEAFVSKRFRDDRSEYVKYLLEKARMERISYSVSVNRSMQRDPKLPSFYL